MRLAREALAAGNAQAAWDLLRPERSSEVAARSAELRELYGRVVEAVQRESLLRFLGPHRSLFEPFVRPANDVPALDMSLLVASAPRMSREFLKRHPYARQLLEQVALDTSFDSLDELVALLQEYPGVNVVVNRKALDEAGLGSPERLHGRSGRRAAARHASPKTGDDADEDNPFGGPIAKKVPAAYYQGATGR